MNKLNIVVLCNNRMAIPAIQYLASVGCLYAIAVPESNVELFQDINQLVGKWNTRILVLKKDTFETQLLDLDRATPLDYFLVMTFPWKIKTSIVQAFNGRLFNFHYGLLPEVRGVDPVFESIRNLNAESGISVHVVTDKLDRGPIVMIKKIQLVSGVTHGMLCSQLGQLGIELCQWIVSVDKKALTFQPQDESKAIYYKRPGIQEVCINWEKMDSKKIEALVRACNPWNKGAYASINGWMLRICSCSIAEQKHENNAAAGSIVSADSNKGVFVVCKDMQLLKLEFIYLEEGFFKGEILLNFGLKAGDRFGNLT